MRASDLAPGRFVQVLYDPNAAHWSLWHTHAARVLLFVLAWRAFWMLRALRGEDLRERRDPLSQQRSNHRWKGYRS